MLTQLELLFWKMKLSTHQKTDRIIFLSPLFLRHLVQKNVFIWKSDHFIIKI